MLKDKSRKDVGKAAGVVMLHEFKWYMSENARSPEKPVKKNRN